MERAPDDVVRTNTDEATAYQADSEMSESSESQMEPIGQLEAQDADSAHVSYYMVQDDDSEEDLLLLLLLFVAIVVILSQTDGRSIRRRFEEVVVVRVTGVLVLLEVRIASKEHPVHFVYGFAVLLTYYEIDCGQDGDGIGGVANQLGIPRTAAIRYIHKARRASI
ncbi:hypothetical protein GQ600_5406 [Phytophthora cactorum]|nr:hypothetical protein GQ600_5406 [Phytophthora cactorum]